MREVGPGESGRRDVAPVGAYRLLLLAPLLLAGCDAPSARDPGEDDAAAARAAIANEGKAIGGIVADVRIQALQKQVDRLEAEVAELKSGKQALDTQLLAQRLDAVEQRAYARAPDAAATIATAAKPIPGSGTPSPRPRPTATPRRPGLDLTLPGPER